jgi:hypothetical protein
MGEVEGEGLNLGVGCREKGVTRADLVSPNVIVSLLAIRINLTPQPPSLQGKGEFLREGELFQGKGSLKDPLTKIYSGSLPSQGRAREGSVFYHFFTSYYRLP